MAPRSRVKPKLVDYRPTAGGGVQTTWRDARGQRVYIQVAPGADFRDACRRIRRRLNHNP